MFEGSLFAIAGFGLSSIVIFALFWTIVWKGFALWIAAREKEKWWFIAMLFINTAGILEIVYIFGFSKWGKEFWAKRKSNKGSKKEK